MALPARASQDGPTEPPALSSITFLVRRPITQLQRLHVAWRTNLRKRKQPDTATHNKDDQRADTLTRHNITSHQFAVKVTRSPNLDQSSRPHREPPSPQASSSLKLLPPCMAPGRPRPGGRSAPQVLCRAYHMVPVLALLVNLAAPRGTAAALNVARAAPKR